MESHFRIDSMQKETRAEWSNLTNEIHITHGKNAIIVELRNQIALPLPKDFTRAPKVISYSTWACCNARHARWVLKYIRLKESHEVPADIKALFENYSENGLMNIDHFHKFLKEVQGDDKVTKEEAEAVMEFYLNHEHKHLNIFQRKSLSIKEFFRYLLSEINSPLTHPPKVHHDMTAPLSHYFIYTGHNSYLTGNQISSDSSEVPVIEALRRGVRVIELDMWPNSTKDDIDIMHGGTLTTPVKLIKCLRAIKANAFVASEYPMVSDIFGDLLARFTSELLQDFPSPDSLKRRVIISTKPPKEYLETKIPKEESDDYLGVKFGHINDGEYQDEDDNRDEINISSQQNAAPVEYKHLIAIRNEKMKGGIKAWLRVNSQKVHRVSLNEEKIEKAVVTHGTEIVRFNQRNLMRVYPKATRIDSSNFNPFIGWMHGAQMVAFNMQIKIYMGEGWNLDFHRTHFDLYSPPDFYVKIGIAGVPFDSAMRKTKAIEDNWMPVWNEEFEFPLTVPELALLRIEVHEFDMSDKDDFGGQTCLPVSELKTGIRAVPLHDHRGDKYKSVKLLMRFDFV
ncbi:hypothetical protein DH2020_040281 [Rehmannia glutinosa]|uniref:Phosphoinositide phospholipase C n=1 Tax=Rehmannia glutinosa TaxID=99300 RepID=A0ABR0UUM8_REHGL